MPSTNERTAQYINGLRELRCDIGRVESWRKLELVELRYHEMNYNMYARSLESITTRALFHALILRRRYV